MMGFMNNSITNGVKITWHRTFFLSSTKARRAAAI